MGDPRQHYDYSSDYGLTQHVIKEARLPYAQPWPRILTLTIAFAVASGWFAIRYTGFDVLALLYGASVSGPITMVFASRTDTGRRWAAFLALGLASLFAWAIHETYRLPEWGGLAFGLVVALPIMVLSLVYTLVGLGRLAWQAHMANRDTSVRGSQGVVEPAHQADAHEVEST
ncbi:MAG: hypothetical protein Q8M66_01200 [Actinomycetota bacterium]|nr:hypothetical protein [Actinomycetota bacterium]MDZ4179488.1 hypothetical protein [Coriobacteriia bacterium]